MHTSRDLNTILHHKEKLERCILALLNISSARDKSEHDIIQIIINEVVELTSSQCGYLHLFNEDLETIELKVWSDNTLKVCTAAYDHHYPLESAGIWADAIREKKPVIHNDYMNYSHKKGLPQGHFPLIRHMSVPVIENDKVMVIIGVGNKETDYDDFDVSQVEVISQNLWRLITNKRYENQLRNISEEAKYDYLTTLITRREFENQLEITLQDSSLSSMAYLDLDNFKIINDTSGHFAGDELLKEVAAIFKSSIRKLDVIGRLGGDEFAIIFKECSISNAQIICENIKNKINHFKFIWNDKEYQIGLSIGIAQIKDSVLETMSNADIACYISKEGGKNMISVYDGMNVKSLNKKNKLDWASRIPSFLSNNQLALFLQPINCLMSSLACQSCKIKKIPSTICSNYEVLLRIQEEDTFISPYSFLTAAEKYNLAMKVDQWVIENTLSYLNRLTFNQNVSMISINLSAQSLSSMEFSKFLESNLKKVRFPHKICFEVTESSVIKYYDTAIKMIKNLRNLGVKFALDDFGSGFSSFAYLKELPIDFIKIDGMFIKDIVTDTFSQTIVKAIQDIAKTIRVYTIAEFVEDEQAHVKLQELGIDFVQGYYYGKPFPIEEIL